LLDHQKRRAFQRNIYFCFIDYTKAFDSVDHNKQWKILKEIAIPDHLTCILRNLYASRKATVRTGQGTRLVPNQESPEELWTEVHDILQEAGIKTIPKKKKCKKAKWLSEEALQIVEKGRKA